MSAMPAFPVTDPAILSTAESLLLCEMPQWTNFRPEWRGLSEDQFMQAMCLVVTENPIKVAAAWACVQDRLAGLDGPKARLMNETAARIKSIDELELVQLENAPQDIRMTILLGLDPLPPYQKRDEMWWDQQVPALELLVSVLFLLDASGGERFLRDVEPKFADVNPVIKYRSVRRSIRRQRALHRDPDDAVGGWLELVARGWLAKSGYQLGVVQGGTHKGMNQPYVMEPLASTRRKFVPDRRSHRFYPNVGDEVLFDPSQGITLVNSHRHQVVAVYFVPAT